MILAQIYGFFSGLHRHLYEVQILKKVKLSKPVFSVGNLTMGGSGKTPLTLYLYDEFQKKNISAAIVCRSYKASLKHSEVVPLDADPAVYGDEAVFYKAKRPHATVISGPRKANSARLADQDKTIKAVLVDDGFQHHKLFKNWNSLVFDLSVSQNKLSSYLREPLTKIQLADVIFYSRKKLAQKDTEVLLKKHVPTTIPQFYLETTNQVSDLSGKESLIVTAIGNPLQFFEQMKQDHPGHHFDIIHYPDHHQFTELDILSIESKALNKKIFCTEKDFVKIKKLNFNPLLWTPVIQNLKIMPTDQWVSYFDKLCQENHL